MHKIIYFHSHETILFAVEELRRLIEKAGYKSSVYENQSVHAEANENDFRVLLITTIQYRGMVSKEKIVNISLDGFALVSSGKDLWIIGNEPRSILYGVYLYCRRYFGYQWTHLDREEILEHKQGKTLDLLIHEPMFERRGNIFETINEPGYINSLIDWGVKNGQNEFFSHFSCGMRLNHI